MLAAEFKQFYCLLRLNRLPNQQNPWGRRWSVNSRRNASFSFQASQLIARLLDSSQTAVRTVTRQLLVLPDSCHYSKTAAASEDRQHRPALWESCKHSQAEAARQQYPARPPPLHPPAKPNTVCSTCLVIMKPCVQDLLLFILYRLPSHCILVTCDLSICDQYAHFGIHNSHRYIAYLSSYILFLILKSLVALLQQINV